MLKLYEWSPKIINSLNHVELDVALNYMYQSEPSKKKKNLKKNDHFYNEMCNLGGR